MHGRTASAVFRRKMTRLRTLALQQAPAPSPHTVKLLGLAPVEETRVKRTGR
jgi:hypothetical protein